MQLDAESVITVVGETLAEERAHRLVLETRFNELTRIPGPQGERGLPGEPGTPGEAGPPGETGPAGLPGADGPPGESGRDGRDGMPGLTGPKGDSGDRGPAGSQGLEGPAGPQGESGEKGNPGEPAYPGQARGLWNETESYRAMDVVTSNGSEWRAVYDNPGLLPGDGWRLGAKGSKGKPGDRGPEGPRGEKGERGSAGVSVVKMVMVDYEIVLLLSDGTQLKCNLLPVIERYYQEAVA